MHYCYRFLCILLTIFCALVISVYSIPTMQGGVETIRPYVNEFIGFARQHPELTFLVTRIGCGIAGFRDEEIAPLFKDAAGMANVILPRTFADILSR